MVVMTMMLLKSIGVPTTGKEGLVTTALNHLHASGGRYALCTMCVGVGQGVAIILERV